MRVTQVTKLMFYLRIVDDQSEINVFTGSKIIETKGETAYEPEC